jgi:hypothetical protein
MFYRLLCIALQNIPSIIVIDDGHFCDPTSWKELIYLVTLRLPVVLMVTVYKSEDELVTNSFLRKSQNQGSAMSRELLKFVSELDLCNCTKVYLDILSIAQTKCIVESYMGRDISAKIVDIVDCISEGNPYWVCYMGFFLQTNGEGAFLRSIGEDSNNTDNATKRPSNSPRPPTVQRAISSADSTRARGYELLKHHIFHLMDTRLSVDDRSIMKYACVIGEKFELNLLRQVVPKLLQTKVNDCIHRLENERFVWIIDKGKRLCKFANFTIYEVIYNLIPPR